MTLHRRSHVTEAVAQLQSEQTLLADGVAATNVIPVPGIEMADELKSVTNVLAAPPVAFADYVIYQPQAYATLVVGAAAFAVGSYVTVDGLSFIFDDDTGQLVDDNYPVGSNSSNRYKVPYAGVAATDLTALVDAINGAYQADAGGDLSGVVAAEDTLDLLLTAKAYGAAGEVVQVGLSADLSAAEWQDPASAATETLAVAAGDVEGIISATDDSSAAGVGGLEIVWLSYSNDEAQAATLTGDYGPGDAAYDSPAGDPGNVGYGIGRLPPGWTP